MNSFLFFSFRGCVICFALASMFVGFYFAAESVSSHVAQRMGEDSRAAQRVPRAFRERPGQEPDSREMQGGTPQRPRGYKGS